MTAVVDPKACRKDRVQGRGAWNHVQATGQGCTCHNEKDRDERGRTRAADRDTMAFEVLLALLKQSKAGYTASDIRLGSESGSVASVINLPMLHLKLWIHLLILQDGW